jgi:hypothetical protein
VQPRPGLSTEAPACYISSTTWVCNKRFSHTRQDRTGTPPITRYLVTFLKQASRRLQKEIYGMRSSLDVRRAPGPIQALLLAWSSLKSVCSLTLITHSPFHTMAGSKRNKVKKLLSPTRSVTPPPEPSLDDDTLMDDLLAQLDEKDKASKEEAAAVLNEMSIQKVAESANAAPKQDSQSRHKARQVRSAERA